MSGTRSHSQPEQAISASDEALLIVAHGDADDENCNVLARELARRIARTHRYCEVETAFIRGEPSIEEAAARIRSRSMKVYPLFMSDGYYVREAIPKRLGLNDGIDAFGHQVSICDTFGANPKLPDLLLSAAAALTVEHGFKPASATLQLVAHGSKNSSYSRESAKRISERIRESGVFHAVGLSFIEEAPFFSDVLKTMARPAVVMGLLAGEGMHAGQDIKEAVSALSDPQIVLIERLGGYASVVELIAASLI